MVLDHPFPPDTRVENEALSLLEAGFDVTVLAVAPDTRPAEDGHRGIRVVRARIPAALRNKMRGLVTTLPLFDGYLARLIPRVHRKKPADALHLHDLYLFGGGLRAGRRLGIPVVGDLHENWVEALKSYAWSTTFPGKYLVNIERWARYERAWVNAVDRLVVVIEEAAARNQALGVPPDRIVVVPNTIKREAFDRYEVDEALVARLRSESSLTITYTGTYDRHRGLDTVIDALPRVLEQIPDARFVIVGKGRITPELEAHARQRGVRDHVRFEGWQPQARLKSYILGSDLCVIPHRRTGHTDATIPHKLFHYMYLERPVIVSDCPPLRRIVEDAAAGRVFPAEDAGALARAILELAADPAARRVLGAQGRQAVVERYNWDTTVRGLVAMYRDLARAAAPRKT